jgi:hypothetical protein
MKKALKIAVIALAVAFAATALANPPQAAKSSVKAGSIQKAKGGYTVAELYAKKAQLAGKKVSVRGKVVKVNPQIMGKNWIHLQDGTGKPGTNDITLTTNATATVGAVVLATCTLAKDKDFGSGYKYDVILENCTLSK